MGSGLPESCRSRSLRQADALAVSTCGPSPTKACWFKFAGAEAEWRRVWAATDGHVCSGAIKERGSTALCWALHRELPWALQWSRAAAPVPQLTHSDAFLLHTKQKDLGEGWLSDSETEAKQRGGDSLPPVRIGRASRAEQNRRGREGSGEVTFGQAFPLEVLGRDVGARATHWRREWGKSLFHDAWAGQQRKLWSQPAGPWEG